MGGVAPRAYKLLLLLSVIFSNVGQLAKKQVHVGSQHAMIKCLHAIR